MSGIESRLVQACSQYALPVPPREGGAHAFDLHGIETEGLRYVTQRALGPIGNDRGGKSSVIAAVFTIDVLNNLLTSLVLEVDVDVRGFIAFFGDEALEQHLHAPRIHFGDPQT